MAFLAIEVGKIDAYGFHLTFVVRTIERIVGIRQTDKCRIAPAQGQKQGIAVIPTHGLQGFTAGMGMTKGKNLIVDIHCFINTPLKTSAECGKQFQLVI